MVGTISGVWWILAIFRCRNTSDNNDEPITSNILLHLFVFVSLQAEHKCKTNSSDWKSMKRFLSSSTILHIISISCGASKDLYKAHGKKIE